MCGEVFRHHCPLRKGAADAPFLNVLFMALAQQGHHVPRPGQLQRPEYGGAAVQHGLVGEAAQGGV